jgi:hypothetical protein
MAKIRVGLIGSGFDLAYATMPAQYAGYWSAEDGKRITKRITL